LERAPTERQLESLNGHLNTAAMHERTVCNSIFNQP
jgi:hypothetical protein